MKTITIPWPDSNELVSVAVIPVLVDWFPRLTFDQIFANALAALDSQPQPFPDPNLIKVRLER